jgi:4-amino-4-deoxy-L-arabinose transferase-like glycosyltransferase
LSPFRPDAGSAAPAFAPRLLLGACILFYLINNGIWLLHDTTLPAYDKAAHASYALKYLRLFEEPTRLSLSKLLAVTEYYPPFFHISSVPVTMAIGFSVSAVSATNFLYLIVAVVSIYRIGRRLFDEWVGVGAVALTLLYPMVYALSREALVDFALIAMVVLSLDLILATDAGLRRGRGWLLGVAAGCAMLTKWTAVTFLLGPALLVCARVLWRDRPPLATVSRALGLAVTASAIVALPWYVTAFGDVLTGARNALGTDPVLEGDPTRIFDSLAWYWGATRQVLILNWLLIPTVAGVAVFVIRPRSGMGLAFLCAWVVPALAFFVLIPNKDGRFVTPLLPAVAMMAAAGIRSLPWKALRGLAWVWILTAGLWQFYAISFAWPVKIDHGYSGPPRKEDWQVDEIVTAIAALDLPHPIRVAFLPNHPDFEPNIFHLAVDVDAVPVIIEGVGHALEPIQAWGRFHLVVSKSGLISIPHATMFRARLRDDLGAWMNGENRAPRITLWRTWALPDGSRAEAYLIQNDPRRAAAAASP